MKQLFLFSVFLSGVISGCSTMHFTKGSLPMGPRVTVESWHHNFALSLYEASEPVNPNEKCFHGEWDSVKTEVSFLNFLATQATANLTTIWDPKTVTVSCLSN